MEICSYLINLISYTATKTPIFVALKHKLLQSTVFRILAAFLYWVDLIESTNETMYTLDIRAQQSHLERLF